VYFSIYENRIIFKTATQLKSPARNVDISQQITPHLSIQTHEIAIALDHEYTQSIDFAKVSFKQGDLSFNFADLSAGAITPDPELLNKLAGFMRQIEKLDSVYAHYELAILDNFHINDRYLGGNLAQYATLIAALKDEGWQIEIESNFRLNQLKADDWYAQIKQEETDNGWFDLELGVKIAGQSVNILPHLVKAIRSGNWQANNNIDLNIKLHDGTNIGIDHDSIKQILSTLTELYDDKSLNTTEQLSLANSQILRLNQLQKSLRKDEDQQSIDWQGDTWLKDKAEQLAGVNGLDLIQIPQNLKASLRDYQHTGVSWLQFLRRNELGGILADDMGLGKTLQVLTHILIEKNHNRLKAPCLIVVPTTLLSNWQGEIRKYTPTLSSIILIGPKLPRFYQQIHNYDIVITSYGTMGRDLKELTAQKFHMLVLDEAQTIKNAKTRAAKVASSILAKHRLCLSGTPIENHLGELWSLFNFLMPGFLGQKKQFQHIYQWPIEKEQNSERQADLSQRVSPFMLRRTKSQVAKELPEKTEITQIIELNESQANLYE
ncbi:MAG TPA: DEAD/DEAH box helicase, partial [Oceanospirillales bacterium]|nr:DEAD/DEAH box helicase [Oceanospirillales bacterium]